MLASLGQSDNILSKVRLIEVVFEVFLIIGLVHNVYVIWVVMVN